MKIYKLKLLSKIDDFLEIKVDSLQLPVETIIQEMTDDDKLIELVSIQNFDGSFKIGTALGKLLKTTLYDIRKSNAISYSQLNRSMNYMTHCYFCCCSRTEEFLQ